MPGRYFEELTVGEIIKHQPARTVTEVDNGLFCALTMNPQPLHVDREFAKTTQFGQPLVMGPFTLALAGGLATYDIFLGTLVAQLTLEGARFLKPVFFGDTLYAETEVIGKSAVSDRPDAGMVKFEHRARNQREQLVLSYRRSCLMRRKEAK